MLAAIVEEFEAVGLLRAEKKEKANKPTLCVYIHTLAYTREYVCTRYAWVRLRLSVRTEGGREGKREGEREM